MTDVLTKKQRSYCMSQIRSKDTTPELLLRKKLWSLGIRGYRIKTNIFGKPDIFFPKSRLVIFIDGCFWHKCPRCYREPKSRKDYWVPKIQRNIERSNEVDKELKKQGFTVLRFWEHEVYENIDNVIIKINEALKEKI